MAHGARSGSERELTLQEYLSVSTQGIYCYAIDPPMPTTLPLEEQVEWAFLHGRLIECNDVYARAYGYETGTDMLGMRYVDQVGGDEAVARRIIHGVIENGYVFENAQLDTTNSRGERLVLLTNASSVFEDGKWIRIWGSQIDVTEEHARERERMLLATVVEQAKEPVIVTDVNGQIEYVNPAFEAVTGFARDEAVGRTPRLLKSHRHEGKFYADLWRTISGGEPWTGTFHNLRKDGAIIELESTILPVKDSAGNVTNYASIQRDVTQERKLERQAEQSQKLEAIGTLAGGIAHDFNNVLSAIIGYTELTLDDLPSIGDAAENLNQVLTAARRAPALTQQILTFSRKTEVEFVPVAVKGVITEVLKLVRAALPATIELSTSLGSSASVMGSPAQLHQVLMNLVTNASHAMPRGGVLSIHTTDVVLDELFVEAFPTLTPGLHVEISVTDTGCGMPAEVRKRVFEPFFTTKPPGEGTGMGLSVAHGIVDSFRGSISVYSEPGHGTRFTLYLPSVVLEAEREARQPEVLQRGTERILFVDDEPALAALGERILSRLGYRVRAVATATEALTLLEHEPAAFDLLISDITMPQLTGDALVRRLRDAGIDIPVVLQSGLAAHFSLELSRELGVGALLTKPATRAQLAEAVRRVLDERRPAAAPGDELAPELG